MQKDYRTPEIKQLCLQQARFAPREQRLAQLDRSERLLLDIQTDKIYPYEFLCYRITGYRPTENPTAKISGLDARHDLRLFVEDLSDSLNIRANAMPEPVLTVEELSEKFNVSTKTISRWREQGLVSRRFIFDGRKRVGFLQSSVDRFVAHNREKVQRGARFSQLTDEERDEIVDRARRLAKAGGCPAEVTKRVARRMNRSVETIRYTLKQFDDEHPEIAVFPDRTGPLSDEAKNKIYQEARRGVSLDVLARQYCRTRNSIYRILNEVRARRVLDLPLDYIPNDSFDEAEDNPSLAWEMLAPMPDADVTPRRMRPPAGLPPYLASLYEVALLTREQEQHLFRKFNYLKHKASRLRESLLKDGELDPTRVRKNLLDEIESLYEQAVDVKNEIIRRNLRLVVSIAKRHISPNTSFFELVSDGNMSLLRAVEKFDYARGNKFSTYASWAVMKNFARTIPDEHKRRDRFRTSFDEIFAATEDARTDRGELLSEQRLRENQVGKIMNRLDDREQQIIISRFGLERGTEPQTLKQVGELLGVTKERIRQIEARALSKLRLAAEEEKIDDPEE